MGNVTSVSIDEVKNITHESGTISLLGEVDTSEGEVTCKFAYREDGETTWNETTETDVNIDGGLFFHDDTISGLDSATKHEVKAMAKGANDTEFQESLIETFHTQCIVTIDHVGNGSTNPSEGTHYVDYDSQFNITADGDEGWIFSRFIIDDSFIYLDDDILLQIDDDTDIETVFSMVATSESSMSSLGSDIYDYIFDWYDLNDVRNHLSGNYVLANDLDETTDGYEEHASETANGGDGWEPIGDNDNNFEGTFDGQGYEIKDLYIDRPNTNYVGLFGFTDTGSVVENIGVVDVDITGEWRVGGLVGFSDGGTVSDSYATGSVEGDTRVGGLIGINTGSVGGSYATGSVTGTGSWVGGLVGINAGDVSDSYSTGSVEGDWYVGGLVGWNDGGSVSDSYATGSVSGDGGVGGLVGWNDGDVSDSYWDTETSGQTESDGGEGKTTEEMQNIDTFSDWDIATMEDWNGETWHIDDGNDYPRLGEPSFFGGGDGSSENPYKIKNWHHLNNVRYYLDDYFILVNDLDDTTEGYEEHVDTTDGWQPIGDDENSFTGTFEGNNYTIEDLIVDRSGDSYIGLFGGILNSQIKNITLKNSDVTGFARTGSLVGYVKGDSTLENCHTVSCDVNGGMMTGGLVGNIWEDNGNYPYIVSSSSSGYVNSRGGGTSAIVGGLVGLCNGNIYRSYSLCDVDSIPKNDGAGGDVGGLCGVHWGSLISECFSTGHIYEEENTKVGGLVGKTEHDSDIENCFTTSIIEGPSVLGGITGVIGPGCDIYNCYSAVDIIPTGEVTESVGLIAGRAVAWEEDDDDIKIISCYGNEEITDVNELVDTDDTEEYADLIIRYSDTSTTEKMTWNEDLYSDDNYHALQGYEGTDTMRWGTIFDEEKFEGYVESAPDPRRAWGDFHDEPVLIETRSRHESEDTWDDGDQFEVYFESYEYDSVTGVYDNDDNPIQYTKDDNVITIQEDTGEVYLWVEYEMYVDYTGYSDAYPENRPEYGWLDGKNFEGYNDSYPNDRPMSNIIMSTGYGWSQQEWYPNNDSDEDWRYTSTYYQWDIETVDNHDDETWVSGNHCTIRDHENNTGYPSLNYQGIKMCMGSKSENISSNSGSLYSVFKKTLSSFNNVKTDTEIAIAYIRSVMSSLNDIISTVNMSERIQRFVESFSDMMFSTVDRNKISYRQIASSLSKSFATASRVKAVLNYALSFVGESHSNEIKSENVIRDVISSSSSFVSDVISRFSKTRPVSSFVDGSKSLVDRLFSVSRKSISESNKYISNSYRLKNVINNVTSYFDKTNTTTSSKRTLGVNVISSIKKVLSDCIFIRKLIRENVSFVDNSETSIRTYYDIIRSAHSYLNIGSITTKIEDVMRSLNSYSDEIAHTVDINAIKERIVRSAVDKITTFTDRIKEVLRVIVSSTLTKSSSKVSIYEVLRYSSSYFGRNMSHTQRKLSNYIDISHFVDDLVSSTTRNKFSLRSSDSYFDNILHDVSVHTAVVATVSSFVDSMETLSARVVEKIMNISSFVDKNYSEIEKKYVKLVNVSGFVKSFGSVVSRIKEVSRVKVSSVVDNLSSILRINVLLRYSLSYMSKSKTATERNITSLIHVLSFVDIVNSVATRIKSSKRLSISLFDNTLTKTHRILHLIERSQSYMKDIYQLHRIVRNIIRDVGSYVIPLISHTNVISSVVSIARSFVDNIVSFTEKSEIIHRLSSSYINIYSDAKSMSDIVRSVLSYSERLYSFTDRHKDAYRVIMSSVSSSYVSAARVKAVLKYSISYLNITSSSRRKKAVIRHITSYVDDFVSTSYIHVSQICSSFMNVFLSEHEFIRNIKRNVVSFKNASFSQIKRFKKVIRDSVSYLYDIHTTVERILNIRRYHTSFSDSISSFTHRVKEVLRVKVSSLISVFGSSSRIFDKVRKAVSKFGKIVGKSSLGMKAYSFLKKLVSDTDSTYDDIYIVIRNISTGEIVVKERFNHENWEKNGVGDYTYIWDTKKDMQRGEYEIEIWATSKDARYR